MKSVKGAGAEVFLDLKLHEIPNSVAGGVTAAGKLGVSMVTVHASGGSAVLKAAVKAAAPFPNLKVLALTVITSLSDGDLPELGLAPSVKEQVLRLADLAAKSGCHGVVASAQEAGYLRGILPEAMLIVTPGIQLLDSNSNAPDQSRVATPYFAASAGASHVVLGRAIAKAVDPHQAFAYAVSQFQAGANNG